MTISGDEEELLVREAAPGRRAGIASAHALHHRHLRQLLCPLSSPFPSLVKLQGRRACPNVPPAAPPPASPPPQPNKSRHFPTLAPTPPKVRVERYTNL